MSLSALTGSGAMVVMTERLLEVEGVEGDVLVLLQLLDELQEGRVADDVDALGVRRTQVART